MYFQHSEDTLLPVKIAIIRSECSYTKGGAERYAANLCRELQKMGHKIWVIAEKFDPAIHPDLIHVPVSINRTSSSTRTRSFHENSQAALKKLDVDQVIALSRSFPSDAFRVSDPLHCYWMKLRYPGKVRSFIEHLNPRHRTILALEKAIMDPAATRLIITNSQLSKTLIGKYYNYPLERVHVIYNGVDLTQFTPDPDHRESANLQLLFVGQDFKRKGLDHVIRAFKLVRNAGHECVLRVIGRDQPGPYRQLARELGVEAGIRFEGATKNIQLAYRTSDLFIFPSLYDPFANVVLESLACGLPALTTSTNGSAEIIIEGGTGYVIEGATDRLAEDLAERIIKFCKLEPVQRSEMRKASRATAENFTITKNAENILSTLSSL